MRLLTHIEGDFMGTTIGKNIQLDKNQRAWHVIDADGQILGRLAARAARVLMGKHRPSYTRHLDTGDFVVVINAAKVRVTGRKIDQKVYKNYSGFPGGLKEIPMKTQMEKHPTRPVEAAIKGMLPKTTLGHHMAKKLFVYADANHPHAAQKPQPLTVI
ncbi:MAG: 50S ribosomal protein L13 [Candidatus Omnitrophica bacterium]|nr:50S ribosomal protein L13 [Candidatus Omnitrophota bacterium]